MHRGPAALLAAPLLIAACTADGDPGTADLRPSALPAAAQEVIDEANAMPLISEINGMVPPEKPMTWLMMEPMSGRMTTRLDAEQ